MAHDVEEFDGGSVMVDAVEKQVIETQMQFPETVLVPLERMIAPASRQHEKGAIIMNREEMDGFFGRFEDMPLSSLPALLGHLEEPLGWDDDETHRSRISSKSFLEEV